MRSSPASRRDRKSTRLNSSHRCISYAVFCLKKKKENESSGRPRERTPTRPVPRLDISNTQRIIDRHPPGPPPRSDADGLGYVETTTVVMSADPGVAAGISALTCTHSLLAAAGVNGTNGDHTALAARAGRLAGVRCYCSPHQPGDRSLWVFFFFNVPATTEIYTLSLHDALPISTGSTIWWWWTTTKCRSEWSIRKISPA